MSEVNLDVKQNVLDPVMEWAKSGIYPSGFHTVREENKSLTVPSDAQSDICRFLD